MRLRSLLGLGALALVGLALVAPPTQAAGVNADGFIRQWDADHDGTLDLGEVKKAAGARFDQLDRDRHGTLDRRELGATMSVREFRQADADKDGTLDKNGDGKLDKKELNSPAGRSLLRLFGTRQGPLF